MNIYLFITKTVLTIIAILFATLAFSALLGGDFWAGVWSVVAATAFFLGTQGVKYGETVHRINNAARPRARRSY